MRRLQLPLIAFLLAGCMAACSGAPACERYRAADDRYRELCDWPASNYGSVSDCTQTCTDAELEVIDRVAQCLERQTVCASSSTRSAHSDCWIEAGDPEGGWVSDCLSGFFASRGYMGG